MIPLREIHSGARTTLAGADRRWSAGVPVSSVELTRAVLVRADRLDGRLGTYLARFDEEALASTARADADFDRGIDRPVAVGGERVGGDGHVAAGGR